MPPRAVCVLCIFVYGSGLASAQSVAIAPAYPARWEVAGSIGWLAGNQSALAEDWNDWYDTFATSLNVGHYWTPHIKTEGGVTFTSEGEVFSHEERFVAEEAIHIFIPREHHFRLTAISAAMTYQFLENTWVHPFVTGGVQAAQERERNFSHDVPYHRRDFSRITIPVPLPRERITWSVRPFIAGGAKFYVNERGFVRTDVALAWHDGGVGHVSWRAGMGIDF
jgi:hypothetical protein